MAESEKRPTSDAPQQVHVVVNNNGSGCFKTGCLAGLLAVIILVIGLLLTVGSCATFMAQQHGKTKAGSAGAPPNGDDRKAR